MTSPSASVEHLRREFDAGFSVPARPPNADLEQFIAIRACGRPLALRVAEISRLESGRKIVPLRADSRDLLGVAGVQGRVLPVFSLSSLMGIDPGFGDWRWIAVCGSGDALGLAFELLDAYFSVPKASLLDLGGEESVRRHVRHAVRFADAVRDIVHLQSIEAAIRSAVVACNGAAKESSS